MTTINKYIDTKLFNQTLDSLKCEKFMEISEFPTKLVERVYFLREKRFNDMEFDDLRLLISQNICLEQLIPVALNILSDDLLIECLYYPGDLLSAVITRPEEFWNKNQSLKETLGNILRLGKKSIETASNISEEIKFDLLNAFGRYVTND